MQDRANGSGGERRWLRRLATPVAATAAMILLAASLAAPHTGRVSNHGLVASSDFTITSTVADLTDCQTPADLYPGTPRCLSYQVHNTLSVPITVHSITLTLDPNAPVPPDCPASDLDLSNTAFSGSFTVPAGGDATSPSGPTITLIETGTLQDGCQNAVFSFDYAASATYVETYATTTAVTSPTNPSPDGAPVDLTATVTTTTPTADVPTGTVTFMDGSTVLATVPLDGTGTAEYTASGLSAGSHSITAVYSNTDGNYASETSAPLIQLVAPPVVGVGGGGGGGGGGGSTTTTVPRTTVTPDRIAGDDRIMTAIATSQNLFPDGGAGAVVLARADQFPDALAGTPLAVRRDAPMLLTSTGSLDPRTQTEIQRVLPKGRTVFVLGGSSAVSDTVVQQLAADGYGVTRLGGVDRFATAIAIAKTLAAPQAILLATGLSAADALATGAAAAKVDGVVVLTHDAVMPATTAAYLAGETGVVRYALGGPAAGADPTAKALVGADRYATSVMVAQQFFPKPTSVGFANGFAFPDALTGGVVMGTRSGPLLLVAPDGLPTSVQTYVTSVLSTVTAADVFGGTTVISGSELSQLAEVFDEK